MDFLEITILGNTVQGYMISMAIFIFSIFFSLVANHYLKKYIYSWASRTQTELDDLIVRRIFPPLTGLILVGGLALAKAYVVLPERVSFWVDRILLLFCLAIFFIILIRFFQGLIEVIGNGYVKRLERKRPVDLDEQIKNVDRIKKQVREISNLVLAGFAILIILSKLGVDLKAVWASLGIGGIALALAVQEPLRNLVGRIYIFSTAYLMKGILSYSRNGLGRSSGSPRSEHIWSFSRI